MCGLPVDDPAGSAETIKVVTVLFADMVDSTRLAEQMDPEDFRELTTNYFDSMSEEIRKEGGTIEKFVGDAVMAVFGVPTAHEDDPIRAIRAARRMLDRIGQLNYFSRTSPRLQFRVGINTGRVVASGTSESDLLVTGDTVNLAARLEKVAEPGTIVVGDRTATTARRYFFLRPLGPLNLKGLSAPVAAWVVERERAMAEPRGVPGRAAPMIGRGGAIELLHGALERTAREGASQLVTIIGDAGLGKSRLTREFAIATRERAGIMYGRCLPYGESVTLWPLQQILKAESGVLGTDNPRVAFDKILQLVESILPDARRREHIAAALASTIGLRAPEDPFASLDPSETYRQLVGGWTQMLNALTGDRPLVVVVEDLHWADPTMLDVLEDLAASVSGAVLFLCPSRPELFRTRPDWGEGKPNYSSIALEPLTTDQSEQLMSFWLDIEHMPPILKRRILEKSEGNPFFLEEIVRRLIDEGMVVQESGRLRAGKDVTQFDIPDNVQAVIAARLDLLEPIERHVLQQAAVVGRTFWGGAVEHLTSRPDLDRILRILKWRELIFERLASSMEGETEYGFKHILTREVAYESLPKKDRARAHAAAAEWIEKVSGDRADELAELLAHHYEIADEFLHDASLRERARHYCLIASRNAHRRFNMRRGAEWGHKAVNLSRPGRHRAEALEALGMLTLDGDLAWQVYTRALAELDDDEPPRALLSARAAIVAARFRGAMAQAPSADEINELIDGGLRTAGEGLSRERALLLAAKAFMQLQGYEPMDETGERAAVEALEIAEAIGDADVISAALDCQAAWILPQGRYGDISELDQRRLVLVPNLTSVAEICDAYAMAAWTSTHIGQYEAGIQRATACIQRAKGRDTQSYLHGLVWRIQSRFFAGDWDGALADHAELQRLSHLTHAEILPPFAVPAHCTALLCRQLRGDVHKADELLRVVQSYLEKRNRRGATPTLTEHLSAAARALAYRGRTEEARDLIRLDQASTRGFYLEALCEVVGEQAAWDEAPEIAAEAHEEAKKGGLLALPLFALRLRGRAAAAAGRHEEAEALLRESAQGFAQLRSSWEEARSSLLLAQALVAVGRAGDAQRALFAALAPFNRLQSVQELETTRHLLAAIQL